MLMAGAGAIPGAIGRAATFAATSGGLEALSEGGSAWREQLKKGASLDEARSAFSKTALLNLPIDIATNALPFKASGILGKALARGASEAIQETLQGSLSRITSERKQDHTPLTWGDILTSVPEMVKNAPKVAMEEGLPAFISSALIGAGEGAITKSVQGDDKARAELEGTLEEMDKKAILRWAHDELAKAKEAAVFNEGEETAENAITDEQLARYNAIYEARQNRDYKQLAAMMRESLIGQLPKNFFISTNNKTYAVSANNKGRLYFTAEGEKYPDAYYDIAKDSFSPDRFIRNESEKKENAALEAAFRGKMSSFNDVNITDQLRAAGRDEKTAQAENEIFGAAFSRLAEREGVTPEELARMIKLEISKGEETDGGETRLDQRAYHGSPHRGIEKMSLQHIGTGEGNQAYGWGIYSAENIKTAEGYRRALQKESKPARVSVGSAEFHYSDEDFSWIGTYSNGVEEYVREGKLLGNFLYDVLHGEDPAVALEEIKRMMEQAESSEWFEAKDRYGQTFDIQEIGEVLEFVGDPSTVKVLPEEEAETAQLYRLEVPENDVLLDWDKPLSEQPEKVKAAIHRIAKELSPEALAHFGGDTSLLTASENTGNQFYSTLGRLPGMGGEKGASELLLKHGIPGLRYLDGNSRNKGKGTHNFVVWDENAMSVEETYYQRGEKAERELARDERAWEGTIDKFGRGELQQNRPVRVMTTPLALNLAGGGEVGFKEIVTTPSVLDKILNKKHAEITPEILKQIPRALADPIMVFKSATVPGSYVSMLELKDSKGGTIVVPVALNASKPGEPAYMTSAYGQIRKGADGSVKVNNQWFAGQIEAGNLRYMNTKKSASWAEDVGLQSPIMSRQPEALHRLNIPTEADLVKLQNEHPKLYQGEGESVLASITLPETMGGGEVKINLSQFAREDSFLHESGHLFLWAMERQAAKFKDDKQLQADLAAIKEFLGWKEGQKGFTREQHEKFAESFVAYVSEGKAPSPSLRSAFFRFKQWLAELYETLRNHPKIELTDEMRGVFDRMLAKDATFGADRIEIQQRQRDTSNDTKMIDLFSSPNVVARRHGKFAIFFRMAKAAIQKQERMRANWNRAVDRVFKNLVSDREKFMGILLQGDALGRVFTDAELTEMGADKNMIKAYRTVRRLYDNARKLVNAQRARYGKPEIGYREGYVPHFFHTWRVIENGEILTSFRSLAEATKEAKRMLKDNPNRTLKVAPAFDDFGGDAQVDAVTIGDMQYFNLVRNIQEVFALSPEEAEAFASDVARMRNRSRVFKNAFHRKGAKGFDTNMEFALRRYLNLSARFIAMDQLKHDGINLFERVFGRFGSEHKGLADYTKKYLQDCLGVPSSVEDTLNNWVRNSWIGKYIGDYLGDRPATVAANSIAKSVAILKLGFLNVSSAFMNATQLIGANAIIGEKYTALGLREYLRPTDATRALYRAAGVEPCPFVCEARCVVPCCSDILMKGVENGGKMNVEI